MRTITGLWREKAEEIMKSHADLKAGYDEAVAQIAFREYDIADLNEELGGRKEEKAVQEDIAAQNT